MTDAIHTNDVRELLDWCASVIGPCEVLSGDLRHHDRSTVCRLRSSAGDCYLKIHGQRAFWEREVHGYEQWASAFGSHVPQLLAVREDEPLALIISDLPGRIMEEVHLTPEEESMAWRAAGRALACLHDLAVGECFGSCTRDGGCIPPQVSDASEYMLAELEGWEHTGVDAGYLSDDELDVIRAARRLLPAFAGEPPTPCHRDYGPANWLVSPGGAWTGVIDFELAYWDVRVADFSRYPDWEWIRRPHLVEALLEGYGRSLTPEEEQQCLVARTRYALSAIVWGSSHSYHGFAQEGREALKHLASLLG